MVSLPNKNSEIFEQLEETLQALRTENKEIMLLGDTNGDILQKYSDLSDSLLFINMPAHFSRILDLYNLFGFHQLIRKATRETLKSPTLIDHIATPRKSNIITAGFHGISISDHYLVYCVRKFRITSKNA